MGSANSNTTTPLTTHHADNPTFTQGSIVEPRVPTGESAHTEEMFLSPRVLDAGAFTRYSEMLKSIITQASAQGRTLEDFSADAEAMIKRCDVSSEAINKRMQAGLRMIKMIDERAERTEKLLETVQTALPDTQDLADQIQSMVDQKLAESQSRITALINQSLARAEEAEARTRDAIAASDGHAKKLADLSARIDAQLAELDARIENTRNETSKSLSDLVTQTNEAREEIGGSIDKVLARAQESGATLATKIDEASMLTDARIAELNKSIEPVLEASQQAMRTLGMDPANPVFEDSPLARIEQLVERGETQLASLDRVYNQLEDLQSQAQGVKAVFGVWLVDAAQELDVLEERRDKLVGPVAKAAEQIAELGPDIDDKLELAATHLTHLQIEQQALRQAIQASSGIANEVSQRMTNESGQLQALLDGSLHKLSTRVEQAGVWLGALIQRAESLAGTLPGAGQMNFEPATHTQPSATVPAPTPAPTPNINTQQGATQMNQPTSKQHTKQADSPMDQLIQSPIEVSPVVPAPEPPADPTTQTTAQTTAETTPAQSNSTGVETPAPPCLPIDMISFGDPEETHS